ncbi:MAG: hypothetical protein K2X90_02600 [Candidatus Babeliaceae bacterium]|nr:hypothetical protein [Candidatus Babeliaceae bacterium]
MKKIKNAKFVLVIVGILFIGDQIHTQQNPYYYNRPPVYQGIPLYYPIPVAQQNPYYYGPPVYPGIPPYYPTPVAQQNLNYGKPVPLPGLPERSIGAHTGSPQASGTSPKKKT